MTGPDAHGAGPSGLGMVVAVGPDRVIGRDGRLPWRHPVDLRHFRDLTSGHTLIVGRVTYATLPPLPGRQLIVVSTTIPPGPDPAGAVTVVGSVDDAIRVAHTRDRFPIVAGGAQIYESALSEVTDIWWSDISPIGFEPSNDDVRLAALNLSAFAVRSVSRLDGSATVTHLHRRRVD